MPISGTWYTQNLHLLSWMGRTLLQCIRCVADLVPVVACTYDGGSAVMFGTNLKCQYEAKNQRSSLNPDIMTMNGRRRYDEMFLAWMQEFEGISGDQTRLTVNVTLVKRSPNPLQTTSRAHHHHRSLICRSKTCIAITSTSVSTCALFETSQHAITTTHIVKIVDLAPTYRDQERGWTTWIMQKRFRAR